MKNHLLSLAFILISTIPAFSQGNELLVKSQDSKLYLEHAVAAKEGLYSIGRLYNVNPRHLASFNKIDLSTGLSIGQVIQVPLTDTNFNQKSNKGVPVYYVVGQGEGLMKVSNNNRKVTLASIRQWNKLSSDVLKPGTRLIVGYINTTEAAALANRPAPPAVVENKPIAQITPPAEKPSVPSASTATQPATEDPAPQPQQEKPLVASKPPAAQPRQETGKAASMISDEGFFKSDFDQSAKGGSKQNTVTSGIFKTISGWQDAKYYLLIDDVATGSIVKITNPANNKIIYAKVLGEMNGIRQNQGLGIRISSAAASALGITETDKFIVKINY